jgi:tRNA(fMet)-specific endonuclease VapC
VSFLIDTDTCSAYLRNDSRVFSRFVQHGGQLHVSVITLAELAVWIRRGGSTSARSQRVGQLSRLAPAIAIDTAIADKFGEVRAGQLAVGQLTPPMDLLIAVTALVHNLTLVTHNVRHYAGVPGLRVVDWLAP